MSASAMIQVSDEETPILGGSIKITRNDNNIGRMSILSGTDHSHNCIDDKKKKNDLPSSLVSIAMDLLRSMPACLILSALNLMLSVPFGSIYFSSVIPLDPVKRVTLGIRMSLLSLSVGQIVFAGNSNFESTAPWQLGELTAFYHTFCEKAAAAAGNNTDAILPTTLYLFSLSTLSVGLLFWIMGNYGFAQLTSFFPIHVVLGLVAGVGIWFIFLSVEVSMDPSLVPEYPIFGFCTGQFLVTLLFYGCLQVLKLIFPKDKCMLLDPIYFLSIPLMFYLVLFMFGMGIEDAIDSGYIFAEPGQEEVDVVPMSMAPREAMELWTTFKFSNIYWSAAIDAAPEILISGIMGLFLVAPYIPMISLITKQEFDVNKEFRSHGYANLLSCVLSPGGLSLGFAYSCTRMYRDAGGRGRWSSVFVSFLGLMSFVYGPILLKKIPRCMAGALLLDMGINLTLEGVADDEKRLSFREYKCVWIVAITMNVMGMPAALLAGLFMALLIHTVESTACSDPVRVACDGRSLPSSRLYGSAAEKVLQDPKQGRSKIAIFQLQGHLFYANMAFVEASIMNFLEAKRNKGEEVLVAILDFSIVLGIDCTAATYLETLQERMQKQYDVYYIVMVSGPLNDTDTEEVISSSSTPEATPTKSRRRRSSLAVGNTEVPPAELFKDCKLEGHINSRRRNTIVSISVESDDFTPDNASHHDQGHHQLTHRSLTVRQSISTQGKRRTSVTIRGPKDLMAVKFTIDGTTYESLDEAIRACEEALISYSNPMLQPVGGLLLLPQTTMNTTTTTITQQQVQQSERDEIRMLMKDLLDTDNNKMLSIIIEKLQRTVYEEGTTLWKAGDNPKYAVFLLKGSFVMDITINNNSNNNTTTTTTTKMTTTKIMIDKGSFVGLRPLVLNQTYRSTLSTTCCRCHSGYNEEEEQKSIVIGYTLTKSTYDQLITKYPEAALILTVYLARDMSNRLQHVSNKIYLSNSSLLAG